MRTPKFLLAAWACLALVSCYKEIPSEIPTFQIINDSLRQQGVSRFYLDAIEAKDYQCIAVGTISSGSSVYIQLEKRNRRGGLLWERKIGNGLNYVYALNETQNGELLIGGYQGDKGLLFKTDAEGETIASFSATTGNEDSEIRDISVAPNGDIYVLALIGPSNAAGMTVIRLRTSNGAELNEVDRFVLDLKGWVASGYKCSLDASQAGIISIAGSIHQLNNTNPTNGILIQLDANTGSSLLNKTYTGQETILNDVVTLPNGNAFAVGSKLKTNGVTEIYLVNACANLGCGWDKSVTSARPAEALACALEDGGNIAIAGKRFVDDAQSVLYFFKSSPDGNQLSDAKDHFGRSSVESEGAYSLSPCEDGGWLIGGNIEVSPSVGYLLKTDHQGNLN